MSNRPALILAAGYSAPLFNISLVNTYDVWCLNHAYRLFESRKEQAGGESLTDIGGQIPKVTHDSQPVNNPSSLTFAPLSPSSPLAHAQLMPHHFCCLDSPMLFSRAFLANPAIAKHTSRVHNKWLQNSPNCHLYDFHKEHWTPEVGNPFIGEKLYKPYLTFLFALQLIVRQGYKRISFLGCDFNLTQDQNYYFDSQLNENQYTYKFRAQEKTLEVFSQWISYLTDIELVSLSPQSRLNEWLKYERLP